MAARNLVLMPDLSAKSLPRSDTRSLLRDGVRTWDEQPSATGSLFRPVPSVRHRLDFHGRVRLHTHQMIGRVATIATSFTVIHVSEGTSTHIPVQTVHAVMSRASLLLLRSRFSL